MQEPKVGRHSLLRRLNHAAVLERLARHGEASRVELAEALTLSQASVSRIVDRLLEGGLVLELAARSNGSGRPQVPLALRGEAATVAAVDIRRDCYRVRLADLRGALLAEVQAGTAAIGTAARAVAKVVELLSAAQRLSGTSAEPRAVALGVSAAWDHARRCVFAARNVPYLEGADLRSLVEEQIAGRVWVENDVRLAALGELAGGDPLLLDGFYYLSLGSGIAGANVLSGQVYEGRNGFAGEVGYLRVRDADGAWTDLEATIGRSALERRWARVMAEEPLVRGLERAPGNEAEEAFREEVVGAITAALSSIAAVADPPAIVLGGSLGIRLGGLLPDLNAALAAALPRTPEVRLSDVGADGALAGGIRLASDLARKALLAELLV